MTNRKPELTMLHKAAGIILAAIVLPCGTSVQGQHTQNSVTIPDGRQVLFQPPARLTVAASQSEPVSHGQKENGQAKKADTEGDEPEGDSGGKDNADESDKSKETESPEGETKGENESSEEDKDEDTARLIPPFKWGAEDEWKLQVGGDVRLRGEYRKNYDMDYGTGDDDDGLGFLRTRLNFDLTHQSMVRTFVEIMDAREIDAKEEQQQEAHVDLHQAFVEFPLSPGADKLEETTWSARLGRQELNLGRDKRLSEASNWSNLRRRFDGGKIMYRSEDVDVDIFAVQPNYYERQRGDDTITRRGTRREEEWFYGAYATLRQWKPHTLEAYFLGLSDRKSRRTFNPDRRSEDGTYGSSHRYTVGSVLYGPLRDTDHGTLEYTMEAAYQFGRYSKDPVSAYFLRGDTTYTWKRPWKPSLGLVGTLTSGDRDPNDGRHGTFSTLFGSSHSPYGIMDFVRPRNMRELAIVGKIEPTEKLTIQAEAHAFWLDSKTDSWGNAPGQSSLRDRSGRSGRSIGEEFSIEAEYKVNDNMTVEAGAAHFLPGSFPGSFGRHDGASFFYLQTRFEF